MHTHTHARTHTHTCTQTHTHVHKHTHMHTHTHARTHARKHTHIHTHAHTHARTHQATAIAEAKMKVTDVGCAVHVCSLIVQRYSEFSGHLLEALQKQFGGGISKGEEKVGSLSQKACRTSKTFHEVFFAFYVSSSPLSYDLHLSPLSAPHILPPSSPSPPSCLPTLPSPHSPPPSLPLSPLLPHRQLLCLDIELDCA